VLTAEGVVSHAALVARGMGVPALTGAQITTDPKAGELRVDGHVFREGDVIGIDGTEAAVLKAGATPSGAAA
jgi:pyruvate, orthophosphate dikinase